MLKFSFFRNMLRLRNNGVPGIANKGSKLELEKVARARTWLYKFLVSCGDKAPDEETIFLPSCFTKRDIFESFAAKM